MTSPYRAVFLLPRGTEKHLREDGLEFSSANRLPRSLLQTLANTLHLRPAPSYLDMEVYEGDGLKMIAATDGRGIENIFFQVWSRPPGDVERAAEGNDVEVFSPRV